MGLFDSPFIPNVNSNTNNNINNIQPSANLQNLQMQLEQAKQQQLNPNQKISGAFGKLQDFIQGTKEKARIDYANNDESVVEKYSNMKDVFVLYMLENSRPQFESWCNSRGINCVNDYVDTFINKSNEYIPDSINQENNKIEMLEKQINELKSLLNSREVI